MKEIEFRLYIGSTYTYLSVTRLKEVDDGSECGGFFTDTALPES